MSFIYKLNPLTGKFDMVTDPAKVADGDNDGIIDNANSLYDGVNTVTTAEAKGAVNNSHTQNTDTILNANLTNVPIISQLLSTASYSIYQLEAAAQTFELNAETSITGFSVKLQINYDASLDNLIGELLTVDGISGEPTSTVLATSTVNYTALTDGATQFVDFIFSSPVTLSASTKYAISVRGDKSLAWEKVQYVYYSGDGSIYPDGTNFLGAVGSWSEYATDDLAFKIYTAGAGVSSFIDNGALQTDLDANNNKIINLKLPSTNGDAIRATTKITEANLEDTVDKAHTQNTDSYITQPSVLLKYVDAQRTDSYTEDGSITKPYKTIQAALTSITNAAAGRRYTILVNPSAYLEGITLKSYVSIKGLGNRDNQRLYLTTGSTVTASSVVGVTLENLYIDGNVSPIINVNNSSLDFINCTLTDAVGTPASVLQLTNGDGKTINFWNCDIKGRTGYVLQFTSTASKNVFVNFFGVRIETTSAAVTALVRADGGNTYLLFHDASLYVNGSQKTISTDANAIVAIRSIRNQLQSSLDVNGTWYAMTGDIRSSGDLFLQSDGKISDGTNEVKVEEIQKKRLSISTPTLISDNYTLVLTDEGKFIDIDSAVAATLTIPKNDTVDFPIGCQILIRQKGAGQVTVTPASDVTIESVNGLKTLGQHSVVSLIKTAANTWLAFGNTEL